MEGVFQEVAEPLSQSMLPGLWDIIKDDQHWTEVYAFEGKLVSQDLMDEDLFYRWLAERMPYRAGILKLRPYTCYKWHTDAERFCSINALLHDSHSHCYFAHDDNGITCRIAELNYRPLARYAFNCAVPHEVV